MSIPNSLTIPPPHPSALETISLFSKSVHLFLFYKFICTIYFQILHLRDVIWYFSFSVWLISLSMTLSRSTRDASNDIISFFLMAE